MLVLQKNVLGIETTTATLHVEMLWLCATQEVSWVNISGNSLCCYKNNSTDVSELSPILCMSSKVIVHKSESLQLVNPSYVLEDKRTLLHLSISRRWLSLLNRDPPFIVFGTILGQALNLEYWLGKNSRCSSLLERWNINNELHKESHFSLLNKRKLIF